MYRERSASFGLCCVWSTLHGVLVHCFEFGTGAVLIEEHQECAKLGSTRLLSTDLRQIYKRKEFLQCIKLHIVGLAVQIELSTNRTENKWGNYSQNLPLSFP